MLIEYRLTGYITHDRFQLTVTDIRKSNCDLRHLAVGRDTSVDRKQIMIKSVHHSRLAYINKSTGSHCSQPPTGAEHGCSFRPTPPTSHPLSDTSPCTGRLARLMSASLKFIAPGITADATSQPEFDRYLAAPAAEACDAMQWWLRMPTTRPMEILYVSRSSICLFRPPPRKRQHRWKRWPYNSMIRFDDRLWKSSSLTSLLVNGAQDQQSIVGRICEWGKL